MEKRLRPCCVPECIDRTSPRFYIPTDKQIQKIWIQRINNEKLLASNDSTFLRNYPVCKSHFADICIEESGRLRKYSLPTLSLPGYDEPPTEENCFCLPKTQSAFVTPEKLKDVLKKMPVVNVAIDYPSTSKEVSPVLPVLRPERVYRSKKKSVIPLLFSDEPGPSFISLSDGTKTTEKLWDVLHESSEALVDLGVSMLPTTLTPPTSVARRGKKRAASPSGHYYKQKQRRRNFLGDAGVTNQNELTPKAKIFYKRARELQKVASKLKLAKNSTRKKLKFLSSPNTEKLLSYMKDVNETTINFFMSQQRTQKYKPRGRRFNLDDKIFALSLYKQSGRAYRYLSNIFSLPSRKTLAALLSQIPFSPGINRHIFNHLGTVVNRMKPLDKNCVLMFDEISLDLGLQYNQRADVVEGLVDYGRSNRKASFADHALVFMLRGIHRKWKQPICYIFCEGTTPSSELVKLLKEVVREVRNICLSIVATISDQGATNQAAINILLRETREHFIKSNIENRCQGYLVDGEEIVHLYDFPHLVKGIRNNLLTKNLHFTESGISKEASWKHMLRLYEIDKRQGPFSQFYKLTDEHVIPGKIRKMKVKNCTQVFSHTVGSAMYTMAKASVNLSPDSEYYLHPDAVNTARLFLFFDKLFDSVNGAALFPPVGKELRCVASEKSSHISFWHSCIPVLDSMYFVSPTDPEKRLYTPSLKNWGFSLRGLVYITEGLLKKGFKHVAIRCFNQDPVENFFSSVRSHGVRNTNPTCSSFISSTKSLLINNLVSSRSAGSNCEEDGSIGVLDNLKEFVKEQINLPSLPETPTVPLPVLPPFQQVNCRFLKDYASAFVAGYVAKKMLTSINCHICRSKMATEKDIPQNILIAEREYEGHHLTRPSSIFSFVFRTVTEKLLNYLPSVMPLFKIKEKLMRHITILCSDDITQLFCENHQDHVETFIRISVNVVLFNYIKQLNKILSGKDLRRVAGDYFITLAYKKYQKKLKIKKP